MKKKLFELILTILLTALPKMTKAIRDMLIAFLKELEEKAKATSNPLDDLIVAMLLGILEE